MWGCWKRTRSMIGLLLNERRLPHGHYLSNISNSGC